MSDRLGGRRLAVAIVLAALLAAGAAVAAAAVLADEDHRPPRVTLTTALRAWATADRPAGVRAELRISTHVVETGGLADGSGLLAGASGRLWLAPDGRGRLDLHTARGDAELTFDGRRLTLYDAPTNTAYALELGRGVMAADSEALATALAGLARQGRVTGPDPGSIAGQPAYTIHLSPLRDAGLLGAVDLAWDAVRGVPLRLGVYAADRDAPVLEVAITHVEYGALAERDLDVRPPDDARLVDLAEHLGALQAAGGTTRASGATAGVESLAGALPFALRAPATLVGLPRSSARLVADRDEPAGLLTYGRGLGQVVLLEQRATVAAVAAGEGGVFALLPRVAIDRASGWELATALGTVIRVERDGVLYTLAGSVPTVAAEAAVRELMR